MIRIEYQPTENGDHAAKFLEGYHRRYLVGDGYDGYNKLKTAARCGCWAHVKWKFLDALPTDRELLSTSAAAKGEYTATGCSNWNGNLPFSQWKPEIWNVTQSQNLC